MSGNSFYLMENPREGERLEAKTDTVAIAELLRSTGLGADTCVLDVGCGTGAITRVMAGLAAPGRVVGVDASPTRLAQARELGVRSNLKVEFLQGDATALDLPGASFDYSWSRFLFEYLPNPEKALAEMIRVTRPGGTVVVVDLDGQIEAFYPLDPALRDDLAEVLGRLRHTGFDPFVGRKLYTWFYQANLRDVSVRVQPYQVYAGGVPDREWSNWQTKISVGIQRVVELTGDRDRWEGVRDALLNCIRRPDVFYYSSMIVVQGMVPR